MQVIVNGEVREIKVVSISTLLDVVSQIEVTLPQGHLITEVALNDKVLESNWYHNASKIYLLDEDVLKVRVEESTILAIEVLQNSKTHFQMMLKDFENIANSFRIHDDTEANMKFVQGIENLQWYLKVLEDACVLLGRPLGKILDKEVIFTQYISELIGKLDNVVTIQSNKDWVMLADLIEYEMLPSLEKIGEIYNILGLTTIDN